jgi:hypothetical protein
MTFNQAISERPKDAEYIFASIHFCENRLDPLAKVVYITREKHLYTRLYPEQWEDMREFKLLKDELIWKRDKMPKIIGAMIASNGKVEIIPICNSGR